MNLPIIDILNQNLITDIKRILPVANKDDKKTIVHHLADELHTNEPIIKNFDVLTSFLEKTYKNLTDNLGLPNQQLQGLTVYTNTYIEINNMFSKALDESKNITINEMIVAIARMRYNEIAPLFKKPEYANDYSEQINKIIKNLLKVEEAAELNKLEVEVGNLIPNFIGKLVEKKVLSQEDDYKFASFSIGSKIISNLFQELFNIIQKNQQNETTFNPNPAPGSTSVSGDDSKVLTKDIPMDGPPVGYDEKN